MQKGIEEFWGCGQLQMEKKRRAGKAAIAWFGLSKLQDYTSKYGVLGSGKEGQLYPWKTITEGMSTSKSTRGDAGH